MNPPRQNTYKNQLFTGDCLYIMTGLNSESVDLIYLDPPFNSKRTYSAPVGSKAAGSSFKDMWTWKDVDEAHLEHMIDDYPYLVQYIKCVEVIHGKPMMAYLTYMTQRILEMYRVLKPTGSLYLHCDPTASHYLKVILDRVFGAKNFKNEVIWWYGGGGASKRNWGRKHDVILFYTGGQSWTFNADKVREAYKWDNGQRRADGSERDLQKGKLPDDVFHMHSLMPWSKERTGYPTQKPLALLQRIIKASSNEGDTVLDPFCGCATTCVAAQQLNRQWIGIDIEKKAASVLIDRLSDDAGLFKDFIHRTDIPRRTDIRIEKPSKDVKERLYTKQKGVCNGCKNQYLKKDFHIDHIVPRSIGGGDYCENYQLLCGHCNSIKGDRPMAFLHGKVKSQEQHMKERVTFGV